MLDVLEDLVLREAFKNRYNAILSENLGTFLASDTSMFFDKIYGGAGPCNVDYTSAKKRAFRNIRPSQ